MCVWKDYEHLRQLNVTIKGGEVVAADGRDLRKRHPLAEFIKLAEEHYWQPAAGFRESKTEMTFDKMPGQH